MHTVSVKTSEDTEMITKEDIIMQVKPTLLQQANKAFRVGNFQFALESYQKIDFLKSELAPVVEFNIALCKKRLGLTTVLETQKASEISSTDRLAAKSDSPDLKNIMANQESLVIASGLALEKDNAYLSKNADPHFYMNETAIQQLKKGFYEIVIDIEFARNTFLSKFYVDYGQGFSEQNTFLLYLKNKTEGKRIIYFSQDVRALRFDPCEEDGKLEIRIFQIFKIDEKSVIKKISDRLKSKKITYKLQKSNDLDYLHSLYNKTFNENPFKFGYQDWIQEIEAKTLPDIDSVIKSIEAMQHKPLFSVVMPTYNTDEKYLRQCIDSVLHQSYPNWEFCIADDNSPQPHVIKVLDEYAKKDKRIKVVKRQANGHISKATNSAIEVATGDYIVLLDHDDLISEHALYFMAERINQNPDAKVLYSDEDKIDEEGNRSNPHFKSDWNPDLFFSQNYVSHLGVYKAEIIKKIGGFRTGVEGSQDQDLLLRCLPHIKHSEIQHIPRVLYHWRMIEGSTALAAGEKSYTTEAGIKALQDYFKANGPIGITVQQGMLANTYKVNWPLPKPEPLVSLLIPTRDRKQITQVAVDSILEKTTYQHYEIIILDNGSVEQETLDWFKAIQQQDVRVKVLRYDHPFNYSAINNFGAKHAKGSIIGLINNDIEVISPDWLSEMVSLSIREDIGCVGAKLYYGNDQIQHAGVILGIGGVAGHSHKMYERNHGGYFSRLKLVQNLSAVTAAVLLVRKEVYEQVGGLDEVNLHVAFNDVDFCLKVREAGHRNIWTPYAELYHHESISRGHEDTPQKQARFKKEVDFMMNKWGDNLKNDPFYSPNLTKDREDFSIGIIHA